MKLLKYHKEIIIANAIKINNEKNRYNIRNIEADIKCQLEKTVINLWIQKYGKLKDAVEKCIKANFMEGNYIDIRTDTGIHIKTWIKGMPGKKDGVDFMLTKEDFETYFKNYLELKSIKEKIETETKELKNELSKLLATVNTDKALIEALPVAKYFFEGVYDQLPSVIINTDYLTKKFS